MIDKLNHKFKITGRFSCPFFMSWVFEKTMFNYKITCVIIVLDGAMVCF